MIPKEFKGFRVLAVGNVFRVDDLSNAKNNPVSKPSFNNVGWAQVPPHWVGKKVEKRHKQTLWIVRSAK